MNYAGLLNNTPQTRPLVNHPEMVKNNAGGYGFQITPQQQLERFLLIGSEGGTFYTGEQKLTEDNARSIIQYIKTNGMSVVKTVLDFNFQNRAPKMDTLLFVLALCCTHGDQETKQYSYNSVITCCKTATHLFTFVSQVNQMRGWSAGLRRAVANWYTQKDDNKLAYQLVKYRNRSGFTHKDVLRLAHPKALTTSQNTLFQYAVGKHSFGVQSIFISKGADINVNSVEGALNLIQSHDTPQFVQSELPMIIQAFETAMVTADKNELVQLIKDHNLTWEMIPTKFLNDTTVLTALLEKMPTNAMIRNLNRFAKAGMTTGLSETTKTIVSKLTKEAIEKSGIHPVNLVNSMKTYASGRGDKSDNTWPVNQNIVDALNEAYEYALKNVTPTGKSILVALDVSGSMNSPVSKTNMSATQLGAVLAVTMAKTETNVEIIGFDTAIRAISLGRRTTIESACQAVTHGGGTDCAQVFAHALATKNKYDAIVILTDNETWAGPRHGVTLLDQYRNTINKDVKVMEIAMVSNPHSTLPNDPNVLRAVGFDGSLVQVLNEFIK